MLGFIFKSLKVALPLGVLTETVKEVNQFVLDLNTGTLLNPINPDT